MGRDVCERWQCCLFPPSVSEEYKKIKKDLAPVVETVLEVCVRVHAQTCPGSNLVFLGESCLVDGLSARQLSGVCRDDGDSRDLIRDPQTLSESRRPNRTSETLTCTCKGTNENLWCVCKSTNWCFTLRKTKAIRFEVY